MGVIWKNKLLMKTIDVRKTNNIKFVVISMEPSTGYTVFT